MYHLMNSLCFELVMKLISLLPNMSFNLIPAVLDSLYVIFFPMKYVSFLA